MTDLCTRICEHEGFRDKPYQDSLDVWTIGHGLTWIAVEESENIVEGRIRKLRSSLRSEHHYFSQLSFAVQDVLVEMAYQLGVRGCLNFKKMWAALEQSNYVLAAMEMLDSKWATQTLTRAETLASIVRLSDYQFEPTGTGQALPDLDAGER